VKLTERLRGSVEKTLLTGENLEPVGPVTISAGIALAPHHSTDVAELLRIADEAMYESKSNGRNQVTVAPSALLAEAA
jgi:diguanylate cyclase (GGDEF)-like protein